VEEQVSDREFAFPLLIDGETYGAGKQPGCGCGYRVYWFEFAEGEWLPQVSKRLGIKVLEDGGDDG